MFEVTVEDTFAAGHYLRNYKGKCENPHGHNYKVRVTLQGHELDHAGRQDARIIGGRELTDIRAVRADRAGDER